MAVDVRPVIEGAVHAALPSVPVGKIDIVFGHDHDDEESWFVAIEVPPATQRIGGEKLLSVIAAINDALVAAGERRFAYVHVRYLGDDDADDGEPARASGV